MGLGGAIEIVEGHRAVGRIAEGSDKPGPGGDRLAARGELLADLGIVGHLRERSSVGSPAAAPASATVVGRSVGVIEANEPCPTTNTKDASRPVKPRLPSCALTISSFSASVNPA